MPSSLAAGPIKTFFRIAKQLTIISGGRLVVNTGAKFVLTPETLPDDADGEEGEVRIDPDGVLYVHDGTTFNIVGDQTGA